MGYWDWGYAPYVSVAQKKVKAAKQAAKLAKKGAALEPVTVAGRKIAREWWGQAWCRNLERYADYSNRIGRGRSYVSNGMVLDLKIAKGLITALVSGTQSTPYKIAIKIAPLSPNDWKQVIAQTEGRIDSIQALLEGAFPKELEGLFTEQKSGLFPTPRQIKFSCSCPDWASMCKHVAAALYGTGARLDDKPELFFTLRGVDMNDLIGKTVKAETQKILKKAEGGSRRKLALGADDMSALFGIDVGDNGAGIGSGKISAKPKITAKRKAKSKMDAAGPEKKTKKNKAVSKTDGGGTVKKAVGKNVAVKVPKRPAKRRAARKTQAQSAKKTVLKINLFSK